MTVCMSHKTLAYTSLLDKVMETVFIQLLLIQIVTRAFWIQAGHVQSGSPGVSTKLRRSEE